MPIVNGTYVFDQLPSNDVTRGQSGWIDQAFGQGKYSSRDWSDVKTAAYNYLLKQQEQAFNLELWNLQNEYNSPKAQMARYQDAGLNPNLIYSQQNQASAPSPASASSFRSTGNYNKGMQAGLQAIGRVMETVKAAVDTYDYWKYGRQGSSLANQVSEWRTRLLSSQESAQTLANDWNMWLQGRRDFDPNAPGVKMYRTQTEAKEAGIDQIRQLISASVTGEARTRALEQLDDYRLQILKGQNAAVLNIHTGLGDSFDGFLKAMIYLAMSKL